MSEKNTNDTQKQELSELLQIRRDKLTAFQQEERPLLPHPLRKKRIF